jgi:RNA polymerase sigma factor (TIGR02999 family)
LGELTEAISRLRSGESDAVQRLFTVSYDELKRVAHARLYAANASNRFATESLLHESYLRLHDLAALDLPGRKHFFAYASKVMRNIILGEIREANAQKRGGEHTRVTLVTDLVELSENGSDVEAIESALVGLERLNPEWARLVEMRFYGGLTEQETADALDVSDRTVRREWQKARAALVVLLEQQG